jgi:hypothetical protein
MFVQNQFSLKHLVHSVWGSWKGRKLMAIYTGYFDESGHETAELFVFGGVVLDVENPTKFEEDWLTAISPLTYLHTSAFYGGHDDFTKWNDLGWKWKRDLLQRASCVIAKHSFQTFSIALDMDSYNRVNKELILNEAIGKPYSLCARFASVQIGQWSGRYNIPDRIKMVFEDRHGVVGETASVFERDGLPAPFFEGKSVCALQAADLIAWLYQTKLKKTPHYVQVRPVLAELHELLHTHDVLDREKLNEICGKVPDVVPRREDVTGRISFHSSPDRKRKNTLL